MKVLDAVEYLRNKKFAENSQYEWINPVLKKVINNEFTNQDVSDLICSISKRDNEAINTAIDETSVDLDNNLNISKISEISEVKNYGLLNLEEPIILNDGLNIFYGENGAGKSSLFKALCDVFGLDNSKKCIPNINNEDDTEMKCKLKILDNNNDLLNIDGRENYSKPDNVKIFDNYISNYIVTNDQKNEFEIPYLKQQYFYVLRNLLEEVDNEIDKATNSIESDINDTYDILVNDFDISDLDCKEIEGMIEGVIFTDEDTEELVKLEKEKSLLETDISKVLNMSYRDRADDLDLILNSLCSKDNQGDKAQYSLKYSADYCNEYNENIEKYENLKKMYESNNITNLNKLIQEDWITNKEWEKFINTGIDFVKTLDEKGQELYTNDKCPYCNQGLEEKSRELLSIYKNIKNTHKEEIEALEETFKSQREELCKLIKFINGLEKYNKNINEVIIDGKQSNLINVDIDGLKSVFVNIHFNIKALVKIENFNTKYYKDVANKYVEIKTLIEKHIEKTSLGNKGKSDEFKKINEKIESLKLKKVIYSNQVRLNKVIEDLKIVKDIDNKKNQLTSLKRNLSKLENSFSSESSMKIFLEKLNKEYSDLKLTSPSQFRLKPQKEKRQIRIGEHKISDIYSEGELKIHSLAEFFAEAEINDFTGVYIFDDPVNSLDFERIGYVKERIIKLVNSGNQVIIFTHNIYFLNSLVETDKEKVNRITKANDQIYIMKNTILGERDSEIKGYGKKIKDKVLSFEKDPDKVDKYDIASVYDLMSGCLESFVENKLLKGLIGRYRPNIRMFGLLELKNLDNGQIDDIFNLYNTTSRYCNRHSSPIEALPAEYGQLKTDYELFKKITGLK